MRVQNAYNVSKKRFASKGMYDMSNKKKAKYKVGDTVVITMYGTVGKITDVKFVFLLVEQAKGSSYKCIVR